MVNMPGNVSGAPSTLRLNAEEFPASTDGLAQFTDALGRLLERNPALEVTLRADRRLPYSEVGRTMDAITSAGMRANISGSVRLNLVILNSGMKEKEINDGVL